MVVILICVLCLYFIVNYLLIEQMSKSLLPVKCLIDLGKIQDGIIYYKTVSATKYQDIYFVLEGDCVGWYHIKECIENE